MTIQPCSHASLYDQTRTGRLYQRWANERADLVSQAPLDCLFGQRWKTETVNSVYYMVQNGEIPYLKVGRNVRIREDDLKKWIEKYLKDPGI